MELSNNFKGKELKIVSLNFKDKNILHKLNNIGIIPGNTIKVLDYDKNNSIIHINVFGVEYVLRESDAKLINVEEIKK